MIKIETIGMLDVAKVNPVLKSEKAVANYDFITDDKDIYLIANTITGDDAYKQDVTIPAGEFLNGYLVKAWEGQKLVVDNKHIKYAHSENYEKNMNIGTFLKVNTDGQLEKASSEPTEGVYFKVTDKCMLTEKALKVRVMVADKTGA